MNYKGLYDVNHKTVNYKPLIFLFIRNEDGTKDRKIISDFKPYLYVDSEKIDLINSSDILKSKVSKASDKTYQTIFGDTVIKVTTKVPYDNYKFKEEIGLNHTYEADVPFSLRYCIDEIGEVEPTKYKILYFDIETDTEGGFPDNNNPVTPIISVSAFDNFSNKMVTFVWREDQEKRIQDDVYYYNNEIDMINAFLDYWKIQDVDIVTAWNLSFDIGYLVARSNELNLETHKLGEVKIKEKGEIEIFGRVMFDLLTAYKKMHAGGLTSYSLNNVAQDELKEEKEKVHNTGDTWRQDLNKLISYNRKDVDLIYKIDVKCKLISIFDDIKRFAGVRNITDCYSASRIHETKIMKRFRDLVFPNKPPFHEKRKDLTGVLLKEPEPGLYSNVICIDAKSLYPSVIYTFNLSTEMICDEGVQLNEVKVKQEPKGVMPQMIKELIQLKDDMKKKVVGTGQSVSDKMFAIKQFINSFYGINALSSFRLYNKNIARNIIALGAEITRKCSELVEENYGYKVIYNDTDSLFIELKDGDDAVEKGKELEKYLDLEINKYCIEKYGVTDSTLHMEFEKVYDKMILQKKRRYAGRIVWYDGKEKDKIDIVGMAARRSDTPNISKVMQNKIFDMILRGIPQTEVLTYIDDLIKDILNDKISKEEISQPVKLNMETKDYKSQNLPKIRGVKWSNKNIKTSFSAGNKFKMIYVNHPETDVICFEENEQIEDFKIDWEKQLDKCVFQKVKPIFEALGWEKNYKHIQTRIVSQLNGQQTLF